MIEEIAGIEFNLTRFKAFVKRMEKVSIIDLLTGKYKTPKEYMLIKENKNHNNE